MLQDANFSYLTGVNQPNAVAVLGTNDSSSPGYTLFVPEPSSHASFSRATEAFLKHHTTLLIRR